MMVSKTVNVHLNWSACEDWNDARARLRFLQVIPGANFLDISIGSYEDLPDLISDISKRGFTVHRLPDENNQIQLRLYPSDVPPEISEALDREACRRVFEVMLTRCKGRRLVIQGWACPHCGSANPSKDCRVPKPLEKGN